MKEVEEQIRAFIVAQFLFGVEDGFSPTTHLFEVNIIDSMGFLELTSFLQARFKFQIEDEELVIENFQTLQRIVEFVEKKTTVACKGSDALPE